MFRTLFSYFKPHKKIFILDMCCAVIAAAVDLAFPLVSRHAMNEMLPDKKFQLFFTVMLTMAVFYVLRSICYFIMTYWGHTFGVRVEADIREDLFRHLQSLDFEFYDANRTGKIMNRLTGDLFEITELAHHGPEDLLISILTIVGALIMMFRMEWRLALVVAVIIPIFVAVVMLCRKSMGKASEQVKQKMAAINADIESCISGMKTSKAFANEEVDQERFERSNVIYKNSKSGYYWAMGRFNACMEFFMCILPVTVISFGGWQIMQGNLDYVDLITFSLYVNTFITPIRKLSNFAEIFTNGTAGLKRFMEVMDQKPSIAEAEDAEDLQVTEGAVVFEDVSFSYNDTTEVLEHVNLQIQPGETVAVVGHSGGGKTTLCQLIPRFYDVTEGTVRIDGTDIRTVTKKSLRDQVGIVQQEVFLFADTILENIRYGRPEASYEEVVRAAKKAEIFDDIMEMPQQFETYVGERGTMLSGGQKQRVAIARIFLKNPKILILDEATSALDTVTESKIQKSFDELAQGRTTLIIAHRLATVKNADKIILIDEGQIQENGTHEELLRKNGKYAQLYHTQELIKKGGAKS